MTNEELHLSKTGELSADGKTPLWGDVVDGRDAYRRKTYGLRPEQWDAILKEQENTCPGCKKTFSDELPPRVHVSPVTHEILGALCEKCAEKYQEWMERLMLHPPAQNVGPLTVPETRLERVKDRSQKRRARRKEQKITKRQHKADTMATEVTPAEPAAGSLAAKRAAVRKQQLDAYGMRNQES